MPSAGHLHAEVRVAHLRRDLGDLLRACRETGCRACTVISCVAQALGQRPLLARGVHDAARDVGLADGAARMVADLRGQDRGGTQLDADAEQQRVDAAGVGLGQLGQVADAHHDRRRGIALAQPLVAHSDASRPNGIGSRIGSAKIAAAAALHQFDRLVAARPRRRSRAASAPASRPPRRRSTACPASGSAGSRRRRGRRAAAPRSSIESTLTRKPSALSARTASSRCGERRRRQAAEVDDVGAFGAVMPRARADLVDAQARRIDDLGEDRHVESGQVDRLAPSG